jgi:hypothetical protein
MTEHKPHPANVPGDFYVKDGCCTMCEVPFAEAPNLFGATHDPRGYTHCFVRRQPEAPAELDQMVSAIRCAELQCIRYRGTDRLVQLRLVGVGEGIICDGLPSDLQEKANQQEAERQREWLEFQKTQPSDRSQPPDSRRPWWRFW